MISNPRATPGSDSNRILHVTWDKSTVDVGNYLHDYLKYDTTTINKYNKKIAGQEREVIDLEQSVMASVFNIHKTISFLPEGIDSLSNMEKVILRIYLRNICMNARPNL